MALGVDEMLKFQNYYYIIIILLLFLLLPDNAAAEMKQDRAIVLVAIIVIRKIIECFWTLTLIRTDCVAPPHQKIPLNLKI